MIIYCHCTRDRALLLPFLPSLHHPLSFHEMIFILVDNAFKLFQPFQPTQQHH